MSVTHSWSWGVDIARAAVAASHSVVATGCNAEKVRSAQLCSVADGVGLEARGRFRPQAEGLCLPRSHVLHDHVEWPE
jgi:hypothetical protein